MSEDVMEQIKQQIENNPVLLFMKGSPRLPQCGFSSRAVQVLAACGEKFAYVDILAHPEIRALICPSMQTGQHSLSSGSGVS